MTIYSNPKPFNIHYNTANKQTSSENENHKKSYSITLEELKTLIIAIKAFVVLFVIFKELNVNNCLILFGDSLQPVAVFEPDCTSFKPLYTLFEMTR